VNSDMKTWNKLGNGFGNWFRQVLNAKCGTLGVLKPMYLLSMQKSTFLLTNEVNSDTKTWNSKFEIRNASRGL